MAHFCIFCERNFRTFAQIRKHKCSPDSPVAAEISSDRGADKENEILLVNDMEIATADMRSHHYTQGMNMNGSRNSFEYLMDFYKDTGSRNEQEMNNTEVKDLSKLSSSDDNMDKYENSSNGSRHSVGKKETDLEEESLSVDSEYVYTLDGTGSMQSDSGKSNEDNEAENGENQDLEKDGDSVETSEAEMDDAGYVYVLESESGDQGKSQEEKGNFQEGVLCLSKQAAYETNDSKHEQKQGSVSVSKDFCDEEDNRSVKTSPVLDNRDQKAYTKEQTVDSNAAFKLVGASKRKRKSSLEGTILHIMRSKVKCLENRSDEKESSSDWTGDKTEGAINDVVFNGQNGIDLSVPTSRVVKEVNDDRKPVDLSKAQQAETKQSPENLTVPKTTNRRKSSVVARCVNVEADEQTLIYHQKEAPKDTNQPLDFSVNKNTDTRPDISKSLPTPKTDKVEAIDLSASSIKKPNGIRQARKDAPALPNQQNILEMMKKFSNNFMNPTNNFMKQNMMANFLQFQMWMQAAAMNNNLGKGVKNTKNGLKNDLNKNVVMRDILTSQSLPDMSKANMNTLMAGPLPNNTATPFTPNRNPKAGFAEQGIGQKVNSVEPMIKDELESPQTEGVINWTSNPGGVDINKQPLTDFKEKDGEPVRFFVKDNEQVQAIVSNLLQAGSVSASEVTIGTEDMKFICRICEQRFFHVEHLTKHVKKRHVLKKYQCTMCDRSFHDAGNYRQHMRVHDVNDVPYECHECQRRFRHKCTLKVHMRIHTGEKPFKCDVCGASFKISSGLQTHMRKHTGETPYACEFCNLRFKCQSNLKQHLFQHTQARPFTCDICGKSYSRKSIRDTHMQTHLK